MPTYPGFTWANDQAGGTPLNATNLQAMVDALKAVYDVGTTAGDLIYFTAASTIARLAAGTSTQVLHGGSTPSWSQVVNADVSASASIAYSKLSLASSITSGDIANGAIVDADVNAAAAIALTKLAAAAWTTYTPTLTGAGGNPVMGSGATVSGRYTKIGRLIVARVVIIFGTSPTGPTGLWGVALPEAVQAQNIVGSGFVYDNSPGTTYAVINQATAAQVCNLFYHGGDRFSGTTPITVAAGDQIQLNLVYETAA